MRPRCMYGISLRSMTRHAPASGYALRQAGAGLQPSRKASWGASLLWSPAPGPRNVYRGLNHAGTLCRLFTQCETVRAPKTKFQEMAQEVDSYGGVQELRKRRFKSRL